jgi:hypothetical protein
LETRVGKGVFGNQHFVESAPSLRGLCLKRHDGVIETGMQPLRSRSIDQR